MNKYYKMKFTEDRKVFKTLVIPADNLAEAYINIQLRFPNVEITEASEDNKVIEPWAQVIAKHMIKHATLAQVEAFVSGLDEERHEEFVSAIWNEWHKLNASKVRNG